MQHHKGAAWSPHTRVRLDPRTSGFSTLCINHYATRGGGVPSDIRVARVRSSARGGDLRVAGPGVWPGTAGAGNETRDASLAPARISSGTTRTRKRGAGQGDPKLGEWGPDGQLVTPTCQPTWPRLRPRRSGELSALPRSGQDCSSLRGGVLDRGNGGQADSWTSQPGRPATRDYHRLDGCRPQLAAQPA